MITIVFDIIPGDYVRQRVGRKEGRVISTTGKTATFIMVEESGVSYNVTSSKKNLRKVFFKSETEKIKEKIKKIIQKVKL